MMCDLNPTCRSSWRPSFPQKLDPIDQTPQRNGAAIRRDFAMRDGINRPFWLVLVYNLKFSHDERSNKEGSQKHKKRPKSLYHLTSFFFLSLWVREKGGGHGSTGGFEGGASLIFFPFFFTLLGGDWSGVMRSEKERQRLRGLLEEESEEER